MSLSTMREKNSLAHAEVPLLKAASIRGKKERNNQPRTGIFWKILGLCCNNPVEEVTDEEQIVQKNNKKSVISRKNDSYSIISSSYTSLSHMRKSKLKVPEQAYASTLESPKDTNGLKKRKKKLFENPKLNTLVEKFPRKTLFYLSDKSHGSQNVILCKLTTKSFKSVHKTERLKLKSKSFCSDLPQSRSYSLEAEDLKETDNRNNSNLYLFSKFDAGVKLDLDSWKMITPEIVAKYIAKRAKNCQIIVDAFAGVGGATIQFAKEGLIVIAYELEDKRIQFLKHNSGVYNVKDNIELIHSNFLEDKSKIKADLVFLNPDFSLEKNDPFESFSIFKHISPCIEKSLDRAFELSKNIILLLPRFTDISEIATLYSQFIQRNEISCNQYSVEIELLNINESLEYFVVYFGSVKTITVEEELEFFNRYIHKDSITQCPSDDENTTKFLLSRMGIKRFSKIIIQVDRWQGLENDEFTESFYQKFIRICLDKKYVTKEELMDFVYERNSKKSMRKKNIEKAINEDSLTKIQNQKYFELDSGLDMKTINIPGLNSSGKSCARKSTNLKGLRSQIEDDEEELLYSDYHNKISDSSQTDEDSVDAATKNKLKKLTKSNSYPLKIFNSEEDETYSIQQASSYNK